MFNQKNTIRRVLLATVSVAALVVAMPETGKADDIQKKTPVFVASSSSQPVVTMFIEGGGMWTGGGGVNYFDPVFGLNRGISPRTGWTVAGGVDYQFASSPWHVSFDFRYGKAGKKTQKNNATFYSYYSAGILQTSATHQEDHKVADFMVGRDIGLGYRSQLKFGLRIADLSTTTDYVGAFSSSYFQLNSVTQTSKFIGVGPRAAISGTYLLQGPWSVDYNAGLAALYGNRQLNVSACTVCFAFIPFNPLG